MPSISLKNRFIFIHIPKTAGTAFSILWKQKGYVRTNEWNEFYLKNDHMSAAKLRKRIDEDKVIAGYYWDDFYKFSIIRNPFDLMISYWLYKRRSPWQPYHQESLDMPFNDFVPYLLKFQVQSEEFHFRLGQNWWLEDQAGKCLVDKVIRLDDLASSYREVCEKVGMKYQLPAPVNVTAGPFYNHQEYYSRDSRKLVEQVFQADIEKYDFEFRGTKPFSFVDQDKGKLVLYCASLMTPNCGISSYTTLLSKAKKVRAVFRLPEYKHKFPACVHVQHEFGNMDFRDLKRVTNYCIENNISRWLTMHTVMPVPRRDLMSVLKRNLRPAISLFVRSAQYSIAALIFPRERAKFIGLLKRHVLFNVQHWTRFKIQKYIMRHYHIVVHSELARRELINLGGDPAKIISQTHPIARYPISEELHREADGKLHVGVFGFLSHHKNIELLIDACARFTGGLVLHVYTSTERFNGKVPGRLRKILVQAEALDWVDLHVETLPLMDVVRHLSMNCVNVYLAKTTNYSSSGAIRQYLAAKRPIISYHSPMVDDVLDYMTVIDDLSIGAIVEALNHYKDVETKSLNKYIEENTWGNSHGFYAEYSG